MSTVSKRLFQNPDYMKENFFVKIESIHLPDRGTTENAHGLSEEELERRDVVYINIANDNEFLSRAVCFLIDNNCELM